MTDKHLLSKKHKIIDTQRITLIVAGLLLIVKFVAYFLTHSNTILTDALESIVNVVAGAFGLFSVLVAALPKDQNHPYGHGKIEFVSAAVEGVLILMAGILIVIKSAYNLQFPVPVHDIDQGIMIVSLAGLINFGLGIYVERQGKDAGSMVLIASAEHLKSDGYSTLAMLIGLAFVWYSGWLWLDSVIAIVFGFIIGIAGFRVINSAMSGIMDEVDYQLVDEIVEILNEDRHPECIDIHNLRIIKYGMDLHFDCHMTIPWYFNTQQAHDEVDRFEQLLRSKTDKEVEFFVHIDPCVPECCKSCIKKDCKERIFDFEKEVEWCPQNIMLNKKHNV